jgi:anti-sigma factor RsiW
MTTPCEAYSASIGELADGTLAPAERARIEAHLDTCAACRALLADVEALRDESRRLPRRELPAALWPRVADQLRAHGVSDRTPDQGSARPGTSLSKNLGRAWDLGLKKPWLGLAAALVVLIIGGLISIQMRDRAPAPGTSPPASGAAARPAGDSTGNAGAAGLVESVEADLRAAEEHYERAIAGLEKIASADEKTLDPQVAATLKKNLEIIDGAIAESRSALRSEPQSAPARESLFEALRRKMSLLQDTIALMNEMRKGNQAGTAQILEGLQKS